MFGFFWLWPNKRRACLLGNIHLPWRSSQTKFYLEQYTSLFFLCVNPYQRLYRISFLYINSAFKTEVLVFKRVHTKIFILSQPCQERIYNFSIYKLNKISKHSSGNESILWKSSQINKAPTLKCMSGLSKTFILFFNVTLLPIENAIRNSVRL